MNKKSLITLFSLLLFTCIHIQAQNFFLTTDSLFVDTVCNETTFTAQNSEKWFCFTAKDCMHYIICNEYIGTNPSTTANKVYLYSGSAGNLMLIAADTSNSNNLSINVALEKDSVYYIKVSNMLVNDMVGVCVKNGFKDIEIDFNPTDICCGDNITIINNTQNASQLGGCYHLYYTDHYVNMFNQGPWTEIGIGSLGPGTYEHWEFPVTWTPPCPPCNKKWYIGFVWTEKNQNGSCPWIGPCQINAFMHKPLNVRCANIDAGPDQTICINEQASLQASGGVSYLWNTGSTANPITVSPPNTTTYTVSGTDYMGCTGSDNVTVFVNYPIADFSITPNPACVNSNVNFNDNSTCINSIISWHWDFGDGSSSNQQNPTYSYQYPGIYTVILTISDGYTQSTMSKQITINQLPEEPLISGRNHVCNLNYNEVVTYSILNADPNLEYKWEISDNSSPINAIALGNGNSISIVLGTYAQNWSFPLKIAVEAKDKKTNCSSIGEYWVFDCCEMKDIAPTIIIDETINNNITYTGGDIGIVGEVHINADVTFDNSIVYFHPGARIYVDPKANFTVINSELKLAECRYMWDGIYIMNPTAKLILQDNTIVRDALNSVVSLNCGSYSISGNTFDNNHKDIVVKNCEDIIHGEIYANSFNETELGYGTGNYLIGHPAIGNATPYYKHLAIEVDKVAAQLSPINYMQIGDMNQMENAFYCDYGISIDRSFVEISRNVFYEFYQNNNNPNPTGYGIKINGYLNKYSTNKNADVFIHNNRLNKGANAIYSEFSTDLLIEDNVIRRNRGVYFAFQHDKKTVIIRNNDLFNARIAAYINPICNTQIAHNTIFFNPTFSGGTNAWGISINEYSSNTSGAYHITYNEIKNADVSIFNNNTNGILIENNTINLKNTSNPCYGILSSGSLNSKIHNNFINGKNANNLNTVGIACGLNPNTSVYCNYVRKCGHGISFAGTNPSSVKNNTMKRNHYGLTLRVNGYIGDQGSPTAPCDNSWQQNNYATYCFSSIGQNNTLYVRNWNNYNPQILPFHYEPQTNPYNEFAKSVHNVSSFPTPCVINAGPGGGNFGQIGLFHKIAKKQIQYASHQAEKEWISEKELYKMLKHDSIVSLLLQTDTILSEFVDSVEQSNLGTLEETKELMAAENMQGAKLSNEMLTPSVQTEYYEKMLNEIMINYTLSNFQAIPNAILDSLRAVAQMCPFEQGVAVYRARALLSHYDTIVYINICEQSDENQYRSSEQIDETTNTETTEILIYPNPTNEILSVEFYGMKEINCVFEICDISGRIVLYHILNDIIMNIDVSKLAKGSYIYRINDKSGNLLKTDKLIIM